VNFFEPEGLKKVKLPMLKSMGSVASLCMGMVFLKTPQYIGKYCIPFAVLLFIYWVQTRPAGIYTRIPDFDPGDVLLDIATDAQPGDLSKLKTFLP
jgi:hypothetical protein